MPGPQINIRRRQLDAALASHVPIKLIPNFRNGFIRELREALAMTRLQLAERMGISQQGISKLELSEQTGAISLNSLKKVALEFDCTLVYALIPNQSFGKLVESKALATAASILGAEVENAAVVRYAKKLMVEGSSEIWETKA